MNSILSHFFRIDPRSLGLFRILFGIFLIRDLRQRWEHLDAFYTNEGVLPNHNHLFNLKQAGQFVWSALHAFSGDGEALFGFCVILFFYACFTLGYKTRAFHVLSVVSLLSLVARNTLADGPGDYFALAMLIMTAFLPLGSTLSLDALLTRIKKAREAPHEDLNDRQSLPTPEETDALRAPGWSPVSLAAFGVLAQVALVMLALFLQQKGAWRDGTALEKALHVHMFASPLGFSFRDSGVLGPLTMLVYWSQLLVPILLVVPALRGPARLGAALLMAVHGLVYGLFTNLGLFGWTMLASSVLVISTETWQRWATRHDPARVRTVVYDADCGICFLLCQLLKGWDTRRHLVFQGNQVFEGPEGYRDEKVPRIAGWSEKKNAVVEKAAPENLTPGLVESTVVSVAPGGELAVRASAVSDVLRAVPGLGLLGRVIMLPGVHGLASFLYDAVAKRRTAISVELGLAACGVPQPGETHGATKEAPSPARLLRQRITGGLREVMAAAFLVSVFLQTAQQNDIGVKAENTGAFRAISWWSRTLADWRIMTPEPPSEQNAVVIDALTRSDRSIDPLTGAEPTMRLDRPFELGPMWASYLAKAGRDDLAQYQPAFRTYIGKRGPRWPAEAPDDKIVGADVYWVTSPVGGGAEATHKRLFRHGRGGRTFGALGPAVGDRGLQDKDKPPLRALFPKDDSNVPPRKGPTDGSNQEPDDDGHAPPQQESPGQESK